MVHFKVPRDWFETNSRHQNRYSEDGKQFGGCRVVEFKAGQAKSLNFRFIYRN